jgi:hypothetical protein
MATPSSSSGGCGRDARGGGGRGGAGARGLVESSLQSAAPPRNRDAPAPRAQMEARLQERQLFMERSGSERPPTVVFRDVDQFDLWVRRRPGGAGRGAGADADASWRPFSPAPPPPLAPTHLHAHTHPIPP